MSFWDPGAVERAREFVARGLPVPPDVVAGVLAEHDRAWGVSEGGRCHVCCEVITLAPDGTLTVHSRNPESDEPNLGVCTGSGTRNHEPPALTFSLDEASPETRLRLRYVAANPEVQEAAKAWDRDRRDGMVR